MAQESAVSQSNNSAIFDPVPWISYNQDEFTSVAWGDVNGDGYLDLAAASSSGQNRVFLNIGGEWVLEPIASWTAMDSFDTYSVAWGDMDGDGDLDLATGELNANKVYLNVGGVLSSTAIWNSMDSDYTSSVTWGDMNGDGNLDLAVGNNGTPNKVYLNSGGVLSTTAAWVSDDNDQTMRVAWGDIDGDGDQDLAAGGANSSAKVYMNFDGMLETSASWSSSNISSTMYVAWGDVDGDGDLDLAAGGNLYLNEGGVLNTTPSWTGDGEDIGDIAWGDVDLDGDLDLITESNSMNGDTIKVFLNISGALEGNATWVSAGNPPIWDIALGDVDGDSDLDLAVGALGDLKVFFSKTVIDNETTIFFQNHWISSDGGSGPAVWGDLDDDGDLDLAAGTKVYLNIGGTLETTASWASNDLGVTSLAWGDMDGDGDLDLAVGRTGDVPIPEGRPNKVYLNLGGVLQSNAVWNSTDSDYSLSIAWGDVDKDGDLDLAVGNSNGPNRVYINIKGMLEMTASWVSNDEGGVSLAWGDVNGDGDLDLAAGAKVYMNIGGMLETTPSWVPDDDDQTTSVAWGDVDGDGDLDLAVGNYFQASKVYENVNGALNTSPSWLFGLGEFTTSVAWGDVDGDGDLDLVTGIAIDPNLLNNARNKIYLNIDGVLNPTGVIFSADNDSSLSVAWGDVDDDGDLDLAVGNRFNNRLYINTGLNATLNFTPTEVSMDSGDYGIAWGDMEQDGDIDLAVTGIFGSRVHLNVDGRLEAGASWTTPESDGGFKVAWGDVNGDGYLDLAVGSNPVRVYLNDNGILNTIASWVSTDGGGGSVAWGDVDGDGDLDLAAGNKIYENEDGILSPTAFWVVESPGLWSVAWGDMDGDGDLDLAMGFNGPNKLYQNVGGILELVPGWISSDSDNTIDIAWGDVDGDGDLDLAAGNFGASNKVYSNVGGVLETSAAWNSSDGDSSTSVDWGDVDGDGDLDLAVGNVCGCFGGIFNKVYKNIDGMLEVSASWISSDIGDTSDVAWGDVDSDGDLDLAVAASENGNLRLYLNEFLVSPLSAAYHPPAVNAHLYSKPVSTFNGQMSVALAPANYYHSPVIRNDGMIPITYTLYDFTSQPVRTVKAYYSLNGGNNWLPAIPSNTITTNLTTGPYPTRTLTNTHVFLWDVFASGFFGSSDNVVFRIEAYPSMGPFQVPNYSTATFPFRVRGMQVRVYSDTITNTQAVAHALVYKLPAGQTSGALPIANDAGNPVYTDIQGYLQGRGHFNMGDTLYALLPITATESYTLYFTNLIPTLNGANGFIISQPGVQELVVSPQHPLILFNLDISLEWDARNDFAYLQQLQADLRHTSELLFDWTNGQAALGDVTIYQAREYWNDAHIRIYAANRLRPNASQGGVITGTLTETVTLGVTSVITYESGQVHMPATWNRFGDPGGNLAEDWPRTLAHELGHYLFFMDDNYIGVDANGQFINVTACPGSMADQYSDDDISGYDEFHLPQEWLPACEETLSNRETGRSDWETLVTFYPWLDGFSENFGPNGFPLATTNITFKNPITPTTTLLAPYFYLIKEEGGSYLPSSQASGYLFVEDQLYDLGSPVVGQIFARGASPGDRLCVFDSEQTRLGCEMISTPDDQLTMYARPDWQPSVIVNPVTSRTLTIQLTASGIEPSLTVFAQLYPLSDPALMQIPLSLIGTDTYSGTVHLAEPSPAGTVHIWVDENNPDRREIVTTYSTGGDSGFKRGRTGFKRGRTGFKRGRTAWVLSSDGQAGLFSENLDTFQDGEFYILQTANRLPTPPTWATVVGQAYRLTLSDNASLEDTWISLGYLRREVPSGETPWLKIYYYNEQNGGPWQVLDTLLDTNFNLATAVAPGPGVYVLMSSIEIPLTVSGPSWTTFFYPIQTERPVGEALASIAGTYNTVCRYDALDSENPWKCFGSGVPAWANDLQNLTYGGYWIYLNESVTLQLKGDGNSALQMPESPQTPQDFLIPPAIYYGVVGELDGLPPAPGLNITALVNGTSCGQTQSFLSGNTVVYVIDVAAEDFGTHSGCGTPDSSITFQVNTFTTDSIWDHTRMHNFQLGITSMFLPVVVR